MYLLILGYLSNTIIQEFNDTIIAYDNYTLYKPSHITFNDRILSMKNYSTTIINFKGRWSDYLSRHYNSNTSYIY